MDKMESKFVDGARLALLREETIQAVKKTVLATRQLGGFGGRSAESLKSVLESMFESLMVVMAFLEDAHDEIAWLRERLGEYDEV